MAASWWSWALLCCLTLASQYTSIFAQSLIAEDVATTVGKAANLTCSFHSNTTNTSVELNITKSMGTISTSILQEADTSVHLLITAAVLTDAGDYECVAVFDNTTITKSFSLIVNEAAPLLMVDVQNITAVVGDTTQLSCTVNTDIDTSTFQPNIMITKTSAGGPPQNTSTVANGSNSVALVINKVQLSDFGEYQCLATVDGLTAQDTFQLTVIERLLVSVTPTNQSVSLGGDVTFSCSAGDTTVTYSWLKNDQPIEPSIKTSSLMLQNVTYFDMATYSCVAMLGNQRVTASANLRINEYRAPFIIGNPGHFNAIDSAETQVVNCDVMGTPPPSYVWEKSKVAVPVLTNRPFHYSGPYVAANGSLMLAFAAPSDSGIYVCYGIDLVTKVNASSSYHITIHLNEVIWTTWYFFVIYGIVGLFLTMVFLLLCYFCASTLDICSCKIRRKRRMKMDSIEADQSGWPWLDTIQMGAPNLAYEMNFGDKHSLLQQPTNTDDDIVLNNSLETSDKQHNNPSEPETTEEVAETTVEQYDTNEEDRIIQNEENKTKPKKNKKEKKTKKDRTEPTTDLFLY